MSSIGGWLILLGLALLVWLVVYIVQRNQKIVRPAGPSLRVVPSTGQGKGHGHGSKHTLRSWSIFIAVWVFIVAGGLYIISWLPAVGDTMFRLAGIKVVQPQQVASMPPAYVAPRVSVGATEDPSRVQIESGSYTVYLDDGALPDWIRVPEGYTAEFQTEGLPKGKTDIGMQCSSALEEPPSDADGEAYWCKPDSLTGRWFRPYIYRHEAETLVFHYHFRRV